MGSTKVYTVASPTSSWLGESTCYGLFRAIQIKAAWEVNQNAVAIILDRDGYIVSTREQNIALADYIGNPVL